jgi:hypothetical protein
MSSKGGPMLMLALAATTAGGCQCEKLFPDKVAMGVARLSVRNIGTAISLVNQDTRCGFASDAAISHAAFSGSIGDEGMMTVHIDGCVLDLGSRLQPVSKDCSGVETQAAGTVTVSGTRTIVGRITGDAKTPVIPTAADAVSLDLTMSFSDHEVRASDSKAGLKIERGTAHVLAQPHLGASASLGVCSVATTDLTIHSIQFYGAHLLVDPETGFFPVDVPTSNFGAQVGRWNGRENDLTGKLTVWDHESTLPTPDDHDGLQPGYQRTKFEAAFACAEDLAQPLSYQCKDIDATLAENLARLTISTFGQLAGYYDQDATCGFASPQAHQAQTVSGADVGRQGATVTVPLTKPCELRFDRPTVIWETCNGVQTIVQGTVSATGIEEISGLNTGNTATPIIPNKRQAGSAALRMSFSNLSIRRSDLTAELRLKSGTISGRVRAVLGLDTSLHVCSLKSSTASFDQVKLENADVVLISDGRSFHLPSVSTDLTAVNGRVDAQENTIEGSVVLGGRTFPIGTDSAPLPLDPTYDSARFLSDDACLPNFRVATSDADCELYPLLGGLAARLMVQTAGAITSMVNSNTRCGFANALDVLLWPTSVVGDLGQIGSITWEVSGCLVGASSPFAFQTDCRKTASMVGGSSMTNVTRTVAGERELLYALVDSIKPRDPTSVTISLDAKLREFSSYNLPAGQSQPSNAATWHTGTLTGLIEPYTGGNSTDLGRFDIPTPLARFRDLGVKNGDVTLKALGMTFRMRVDQANITAQNGVYRGKGNFVQGDITIDGHAVHIDPTTLDPEYDQASFDDSYRCTTNLASVLPSLP